MDHNATTPHTDFNLLETVLANVVMFWKLIVLSLCEQVKKNREKRLKEKETRLEQLRTKKEVQFKARHLLQKVTSQIIDNPC